jgi:cobalt/nickel transport system permease protein
VHRLPSQLKILALLAFLLVVVTTPITHIFSYTIYFTLIFAVILVARLPLLTVLKRSLIEIPFVLFALLMPFFGSGESYEIAGFTLYREGILAGTAIVAKGTLGVLGAITLSSTSTAREILRGLERLRLPALMVNIASFMLRYINVVTDEMERMRIARASRGFEARGIRDWRILASVVATLFMRSYERGERVHLAMLSRGFTGVLPRTPDSPPTISHYLQVTSLPGLALLLSLMERILR